LGVAELLVPFFFAGISLQFNLAAFVKWPAAALALAVFALAVASKLIGRSFGPYSLGRREAIRVGEGIVPRGEVRMIVAPIGSSLPDSSKKTMLWFDTIYLSYGSSRSSHEMNETETDRQKNNEAKRL
jgi:Kef-type K+ transport system membrane component KefB